MFVDASAPPGGDGSRAHPLRTLAQTPRRARVRLAAGVYPGGVLLEDTELVGGKSVVLASPGDGPCVRTRGQVRLEGIQIQGGAAGLVVESGRTSLDSVGLSGQRGPAIVVQAAAELVAARSTVQASVSGYPGLRVLAGGRADLVEVQFRGPFQRAVEATAPAALHLAHVQVQEAVTGVWLSGGSGSLESIEIRGGRGPALYVAGATLTLRDVRMSGHEYGLLAGGEARVEAKGLRSTGAERAGVALVRSQAVLAQVHVESGGQLAGVQLVSSDVRIQGLEITGGRSSGLVTRDGQLTLEDATVVGPRAKDALEGDAIQIRGGRASLVGVRVQDCSGIGLVAAEGASVTLVRSSVRGAGVAGVAVETEASLTATELSIQGTSGPAVLVTDRGTATLGAVTARSNRDGAVWAECGQGARVELDGWSGDAMPAPTPCIRSRSVSPQR